MKYFVYENGEQAGPLTVEELRERGLRSDTLVWAEGMAQWQPAWEVQELKEVIEGRPAAQADTATPPPVPQHQYAETVPVRPQHHGSHFGCFLFLIVALGMFIALFVTNPDRSKHSAAISQEINEALNSKDVFGSGIMSMLSSMVSSKIIDEAVGQMLYVDSYGVCSVGHIRLGKQVKTVSFGILGHVFTFDSKDFLKKMKGNSSTDVEMQEDDDSALDDSI